MSDVCKHCEAGRSGTPARKPGTFEDISHPELCGTCLLIPEEVRTEQKSKSVKLKAQAEKMLAEAQALIKGAKAIKAGKVEEEPEKQLSPSEIAARVDAIAGKREPSKVDESALWESN